MDLRADFGDVAVDASELPQENLVDMKKRQRVIKKIPSSVRPPSSSCERPLLTPETRSSPTATDLLCVSLRVREGRARADSFLMYRSLRSFERGSSSRVRVGAAW